MLLVVDTNILVNAIKSPGIKNTDGSIIPSKSQRLFIEWRCCDRINHIVEDVNL